MYSISFEGGPVSGDVIHGMTADTPYVCFSIDGRWEHYVWVEGDRFTHLGACRLIGHSHPDCGHDHASGW